MPFDSLNDPATQRRFAYERGTLTHAERVRPKRDGPLLFGFGDNDHEPAPSPTHVLALRIVKAGPLPPPTVPLPPPLPPSTGEKGKARDILAAIRTLKSVEAEHRPPTDDEMQALRRFGGSGAVALSIFPDPITGKVKDGWQPLVDELRDLLTPEEYDSAKRTTFTAFYTAPVVMDAMHEALARLGVPQSAVILESGAGIGRFMDASKPGQRFIGVALDGLSSRIARALHPGADIRVENFHDNKSPPLDALIGCVPFADIKLTHKDQRLGLHDFFIGKSVDSLKPGGVLAVVTSHYTMDKQNGAARELIASQADFLGAIRLPCDAFKAEGTLVTTDILFLRKRAPGQMPNHADPEWLQISVQGIQGPTYPSTATSATTTSRCSAIGAARTRSTAQASR